MITQKQSEFELHAKAILGLPVDTSLSNPGASAVIYGGHDCDAIAVENIPKALAGEGLDIRLFGKPQSFKRRRMGVILAHADDIQQARNKAQQARSQIKTKPV
jgi:phosphoribosylglycinamide formyltransferase 2